MKEEMCTYINSGDQLGLGVSTYLDTFDGSVIFYPCG